MFIVTEHTHTPVGYWAIALFNRTPLHMTINGVQGGREHCPWRVLEVHVCPEWDSTMGREWGGLELCPGVRGDVNK